jgi:RNA polymerase-binding transcription factor DksA
MPDAMDHVQELNEAHVEDALKRHSARPVVEGRATCANAECGEPISDARRRLGAQLCMECQRGVEAAGAHRRVWSGR